MMRQMPGPGDEATWGPYVGACGDPRAPMEPEDCQICGDPLVGLDECYEIDHMPLCMGCYERAIELTRYQL